MRTLILKDHWLPVPSRRSNASYTGYTRHNTHLDVLTSNHIHSNVFRRRSIRIRNNDIIKRDLSSTIISNDRSGGRVDRSPVLVSPSTDADAAADTECAASCRCSRSPASPARRQASSVTLNRLAVRRVWIGRSAHGCPFVAGRANCSGWPRVVGPAQRMHAAAASPTVTVHNRHRRSPAALSLDACQATATAANACVMTATAAAAAAADAVSTYLR